MRDLSCLHRLSVSNVRPSSRCRSLEESAKERQASPSEHEAERETFLLFLRTRDIGQDGKEG